MMGVANWFRTFCAKIQVQDGGTISTRYRNITRRLNKDFWRTDSYTSHSLYVGSYGRNTAIQGFSDLDITFELPPWVYQKYDKYTSNGQSALLQAVKRSIEKTYQTTAIRADGQIVLTPFTDGIRFEVVPVFVNSFGSYTYPDTNYGGRWCITNPRPEIEAIQDRNADCNKNLVSFCRMMRAWRSKWDVLIGGLLIDTLAYQFIGNWAYRKQSFSCYAQMCRDFFRFMATQSVNQAYWLAPGSRQRVYRKGNFQRKAKQCYNLSLEAIEHETALPKQVWSAKKKWRKIFGPPFPK